MWLCVRLQYPEGWVLAGLQNRKGLVPANYIRGLKRSNMALENGDDVAEGDLEGAFAGAGTDASASTRGTNMASTEWTEDAWDAGSGNPATRRLTPQGDTTAGVAGGATGTGVSPRGMAWDGGGSTTASALPSWQITPTGGSASVVSSGRGAEGSPR